MDNDLQIDNVQSFFKVIRNKNILSRLLGREVMHFIQGRAKVNAVNYKSSELVIYFLKSTNNRDVFVRYSKERFIREFGDIYPPISVQEMIKFGEIAPLISHTKIIELIQAGQAERQEAEKQEIEKQQAEIREAERLEAQRLEAQRQDTERLEAQRREAERRKVQKQALLEKLKDQFEIDFLNVDKFYQNQCTEYISLEEYQTEKSKYVQSWVQRNLNSSPDLEQAAAIGAVEGHIQVVARAGSGKTSTLVNRALFLQKYCGIAASEILILAFNRKAAEEIKERLTLQRQDSIPHVMTFHALAYALVHPEESILFNEPDGQQNKSRVLQNVTDEYLQNPIFYDKIRALMIAHFREDWERIVSGGYDKSPEAMLCYRRSLPKEGIDGTYFKSFGEKLIGDFLFEHNIQYKYERNFWWDGINYRPDFTIATGENQGVVIEYFGLEGDPDYDMMSEAKREYWQNHLNWQFWELSPKTLRSEGVEAFTALLKQHLESYGIECHRLSEEEIWQKIKVRAIDRFTKVVEGFVQRCRKLTLTSEKLASIVANHHCDSDVEQRFLDLAQIFYQSYLGRLQATGEEDFDGLMQQAATIVNSGQIIFRRKSGTGDLKSLKYILIDEYQDFSLLFHNLVTAVRLQNPEALFFCVGDDWQAINGFAGSDLRFYRNFGEFFQPFQKLQISTNYRSATSIVDIGNKLMQGLGNPAHAYKKTLGIVEIADIRQFEPTPSEQENHPGDNLTPAILRLVDQTIKDGTNVVLLSRKNSLPWYVNYGKLTSKDGSLDSFLSLIRSYLPKESRNAVTISTAHKYKGLQKDVVIILDAVPRCYPLIHPDLMFTRVFGDSLEQIIDEERRLFYVALTRAVERLFILTETNNLSPFLEELKSRRTISLLDWLDYPPFVSNVQRITVKVGNQPGTGGNGTYTIKDLLKAEGYKWKSLGWQSWYCTYPAQDFSIQQYFDNARWISHAVGIEVRFYDDLQNILAKYHVEQGQCTPIIINNFAVP
jgi:DNA helicase IV